MPLTELGVHYAIMLDITNVHLSKRKQQMIDECIEMHNKFTSLGLSDEISSKLVNTHWDLYLVPNEIKKQIYDIIMS